jgi:hypothetical protein
VNPLKNDPAALAQPGVPQAPLGSNGNSPDSCGQGDDTEELTYDPAPPKKTVTVSVRYRIGGRGQAPLRNDGGT